MHVLPEGIIPYELGTVLYEFTNVRKLMTLDDCNEKVCQMLSTMEVDKSDTPPELNPITYGKDLSPKFAACEMMALLHIFTYLFGDKKTICIGNLSCNYKLLLILFLLEQLQKVCFYTFLNYMRNI